jgi:spermidine synthase
MTKPDPARYLPVLLLLFAASGCSALIYEIVWYQILQLAIGSTTVSMGFLLASFMGGLCIGSVGLSRLNPRQHPLRIYAWLEFGVALTAILVLFALPLIQRAYIAGASHGLPGMLLRGAISAVCLLPPTILMGASLPAAARWIKSTARGASWWGLLYGVNTAGAVFGCLMAGFWLLRLYNVSIATYVAAAINVSVGAIGLLLAARTPADSELPEEAESMPAAGAPGLWTIYVTIALSGASALGAEVIWTRLMGYLLGATVYVFSIILAVFLIGLAAGSTVGSSLARTFSGPGRARLALGWCQILQILAIAWSAYMIADSLPYWPVNPLISSSPWFNFQIDMVRCLWAVLPPALLWGASFPLALAAVATPGKDPGRLVGAVYAANTLGAIVGALGMSIVLVPGIGTRLSQCVLLYLAAAGACFALAPHVRQSRSKTAAVSLAIAVVLAVVLASKVDPIPGDVIAFGRKIMTSAGSAHILYTKEGINSSVAISQWSDGAMQIDVNGHVEATNEPYDMRLQRMVGHLPGILHPNPRSVLGIGFGAGVSAGTFTRYPTIEKITICEIEPVIPPTSTRFFAREDYDVMHNPRTHIVFDDARHYLLTTTDKFDIIASDPLDVFVKGTAALYSKEYFESVKQHLNPGGIFTLYVPLYETDMRTIKSELATFFEAFPYGTIWFNNIDGQGYDTVFMGHLEPARIDLDEIQARLSRPEYAPVVESLREIEVASPLDLMTSYAGQKSDFAEWLRGAEINRDNNLKLQYLAGWGINSDMANQIYREMVKYRRPPQNLFAGSPPMVQMLLASFGR